MSRTTATPPTARARVDLFLATVAQYEDFATVFEFPRTLTLAAASPKVEEHWLRLMHASILRKYMQEGDDVFLSTVINSISQCMDTSNPEVAGTWRDLKKMVRDIKKPRRIQFNVNGVDIAGHELALDVLYGTLLHGDWERWNRSKNFGMLMDSVMFDWVSDVESLVVGVRGFWELALRDGLVFEPEAA